MNTLKSKLARALAFAHSDALIWADEMFTARDEMNAKVHCAPLRLSPITERIRQMREENARLRPILDSLSECVEALGMIDHVGMPAPYDKIAREALKRLAEKLGETE